MQPVGEVVVDPGVHLVTVELLRSGGDVIVTDARTRYIRRGQKIHNVGEFRTYREDVRLSIRRNSGAIVSISRQGVRINVSRIWIEYHAGLCRYRAALCRRNN